LLTFDIKLNQFNQVTQRNDQWPVSIKFYPAQIILSSVEEQVMSLEDRAKATAKNIEGKVQEAVGDLTGDPKTQAEDKEKQAEAKVRHTVENIKEEVKQIID
jgi:uncharacterized protein YjbJ (UPF0337 family)